MYLTYDEYQNMGGTLSESTFTKFAYRADSIIDWYTFNRLENETEYPEKVKKCVFMLIDILVSRDLALNSLGDDGEDDGVIASIASQSNDGVSVSYNVLSASEAYKYSDEEIGNVVRRTLQGVVNTLGRKLLYRGLYPDE